MTPEMLEMIWRAFVSENPNWRAVVDAILENNLVFVIPASTSTVGSVGDLKMGDVIVLEPGIKGRKPIFRIDAAGNITCVNHGSTSTRDTADFIAWLLHVSERWSSEPETELADRFFATLGEFK